jgi:uncharacterized membrane protein HdeD (DUF308 family)
MKRHHLAIVVGVAMFITGFFRLKQPGDEVFRVQQWTLVIAGALVTLLGWLAERRPRNAGFVTILASMAAVMSGLMALPFQAGVDGFPGLVLGLTGMAAGIYLMAGTRMGDR